MGTVKDNLYPTRGSQTVTSKLTPVEWIYHSGFTKITEGGLFGLDNWKGTLAEVKKSICQITAHISPQPHDLTFFVLACFVSKKLPGECQVTILRWNPGSSSISKYLCSTDKTRSGWKDHLLISSSLIKVKWLPQRCSILLKGLQGHLALWCEEGLVFRGQMTSHVWPPYSWYQH